MISVATLYAGAAAMAAGQAGDSARAQDVVGDDPVPHADDLWVSTDDVLDYARWISRRVNELDALVTTAAADPDTQHAQKVLQVTLDRPNEAGWISWSARWRAFAASLESSWWDRVNAWTKCTVFHDELCGFGDRFRAAGVAAPDLRAPPKDQEGLTTLVDDVSKAATLPAMLLIGGVLAGAWFLSSARK